MPNFPNGSPARPPSPMKMYRYPSWPKRSCPPLWLDAGSTTSRMVLKQDTQHNMWNQYTVHLLRTLLRHHMSPLCPIVENQVEIKMYQPCALSFQRGRDLLLYCSPPPEGNPDVFALFLVSCDVIQPNFTINASSTNTMQCNVYHQKAQLSLFPILCPWPWRSHLSEEWSSWLSSCGNSVNSLIRILSSLPIDTE